jgi:hypothetical protein
MTGPSMLPSLVLGKASVSLPDYRNELGGTARIQPCSDSVVVPVACSTLLDVMWTVYERHTGVVPPPR